MKHTLVMCYMPTPDDPIFRCACWSLSSGKTKGIWTITLRDGLDGRQLASFSPSVDWPEHFHDFFHDVPVARDMDELAINPEWA